jgi:hypothetical protein
MTVGGAGIRAIGNKLRILIICDVPGSVIERFGGTPSQDTPIGRSFNVLEGTSHDCGLWQFTGMAPGAGGRLSR